MYFTKEQFYKKYLKNVPAWAHNQVKLPVELVANGQCSQGWMWPNAGIIVKKSDRAYYDLLVERI